MTSTSYRDFVMAMQRVEQRLKCVTRGLDAARIPYAVVGGNAVAAWVARIDPAATRTTKYVDLLARLGGREGAAVVRTPDAGRSRGGA